MRRNYYEINIDFDYICCPCGTGTTLAGLISELKPGQKAIGFSALKGGDFLYDEIEILLKQYHNNENNKNENKNFEIETKYHFGGYARADAKLYNFINKFEEKHPLILEQVYTAQMFFGLYEMINAGRFDGKTVIAIHTGGLQGKAFRHPILSL